MILKLILRLIAGSGAFFYGASYEAYKLAIPNMPLRIFISILIWLAIFSFMAVAEGCNNG